MHRYASVLQHHVYVETQDARGRHLLKCNCGCQRKATHRAMANGICMGEGCEVSMWRFAKHWNVAKIPKHRKL